MREAQKCLKKSNFCDTQPDKNWEILEMCIPLKFVLRQTVFISIKILHARIFDCICVKETIYTWILLTLTL